MKKFITAFISAVLMICMAMPAFAAQELYGISWDDKFTVNEGTVSFTTSVGAGSAYGQLITPLEESNIVNINFDLAIGGPYFSYRYFRIYSGTRDNSNEIINICQYLGRNFANGTGSEQTFDDFSEKVLSSNADFHNYNITLDFLNHKATIVTDGNTSSPVIVNIPNSISEFRMGYFRASGSNKSSPSTYKLKNIQITPGKSGEVALYQASEAYTGDDVGYTASFSNLSGQNTVTWYAKPSNASNWTEISSKTGTSMYGESEYVFGLIITDIGEENSLDDYDFSAEASKTAIVAE